MRTLVLDSREVAALQTAVECTLAVGEVLTQALESELLLLRDKLQVNLPPPETEDVLPKVSTILQPPQR